MKTKLLFILIALFFSCTTTRVEKTISIIDNRESDAPVDQVGNHKDKDVVITRVITTSPSGHENENSYLTTMYLMDKGNLKAFNPFIASAKDDYDKATYKWVNDSTLTIKLINSSTKNSESFKIINSEKNASIEKL